VNAPQEWENNRMCIVSMVSDHYQKHYPEWFEPVEINPTVKPVINIVRQMPDDIKEALRDIVKRLDEIDKKLNERDCHDDSKERFFKTIGLSEEE
jgi:hypothetical protein